MKIALVYAEYENLPRIVSDIHLVAAKKMKGTLEDIEGALERGGHTVYKIPANVDMLRNIVELGKIDLIFCHYSPMINKKNQGNVFAALELLNIPMVGAGMYGQTICQYKETTKDVLRGRGLPTAASQLFVSKDDKLKDELKEKFPLFVKPESEAESVGIYEYSLVNNEKELKKSLENIFKIIDSYVLVEEYLPGREFTVGVLGDEEEIIALPILEIIYKNDGIQYMSVENKGNGTLDVECPAKLSSDKEKLLKEYAKEAFFVVKGKVYLRVDFRFDKYGNPQIIEVNSMPGLRTTGFFPEEARAMGIEYDELINKMAEIGARQKIEPSPLGFGKF